ncbi:hypothetical protein D3C75_528910 [compost metagenome]
MITLIIRCYGESAFGGRTEDTFILSDFNSLSELNDHIKNEIPIVCKEPTSYHKQIIIKEDLRERIVYLNNYLKIKHINYDIMTRKEIQDFEEKVCTGCGYNDGSLSGYLSCRFESNGEGGCSNMLDFHG